jgi:hypothetical protein
MFSSYGAPGAIRFRHSAGLAWEGNLQVALAALPVFGPFFPGRCQWGRQEIGWFPSLFFPIFALFCIIR